MHVSGLRHLSRRWSGGEETHLITDAHQSPVQEWHHRRRVYAGLQLARIPLIIIAFLVLYLGHNMLLGVIIIALSLPLPWIAVLLANNPGEKADKRSPRVYKPAQLHTSEGQQSRPESLLGSTDNSEPPLIISSEDQ